MPQHALRTRALAATAALIAVIGSVTLAAPAQAADQGQITVNKTVNAAESATLAPGDEFTYAIQVGCDDAACVDAHMTDPIPAQFAGFAITKAPVATPSNQPSAVTLIGCSVASGVTASCTLDADFNQPLPGGDTGIDDGATYTVTIGLKVPQNLTPAWPFNDQVITNTANGTAANSTPASDGADVTVHVPVVVDTAVTKTWAPASQQYAPGAASTVTLTTRNTSNVPAAGLTLQDPQNAVDGAASIGADNPFDLVDFSGFGAVTAPQGADQVQVDAYVLNGGVWGWVTGTPTAIAAIALPGGVTAPQVAGLRISFTDAASGATIDPNGTAGSVAVNVAQRATTRSGAALVTGDNVTNVVADTVTVPGQAPTTVTASAPYAITGLTVKVGAAKTITPAQTAAGVPATAVISAQNQSNGPVSRLSLDDSDYFTQKLRFNGFTAPVAWPTGATDGAITWRFSDGSQSGPTTFASGSSPAAPAAPTGAWLTGFMLDYTGSVPATQSATAQFSILPAADMVTQAQGSIPTTNSVAVSATNPAGDAGDTASAPLTVYYPQINLALSKAIAPTGAVAAGGTVVAKLSATTSTQSQFVSPDTIVVEDSLRAGATDFWNAFDPVAIAPTAVAAGTRLLVEYTTDGTAWQTLTTVDATGGAQTYSGSLPGGVVGVRFTFTEAGGFPKASSVQPNLVFQARSQLRDNSGPTAVAGDPAKDYTNQASAQGSGVVDGPTPITADPVTADADGHVIAYDGAGGGLDIQKRWVDPGDFSTTLLPLSSQSGAPAGTTLDWGVRQTGFSSVTVSDPSSDAGAADASTTAFDAFDLVAIPAITTTVDPLLTWDTVQSVELYSAAQGWHAVPAPSGGWMSASGFVGYTLTAAERAATTGVRFVIVPNDAARAASSDPTRPLVGSGVATSSTTQVRHLRLLWSLRNVARVAGGPSSWVTATHGYDVPGDADAISNTAAMSGQRSDGPVGPVTGSDTITLVDAPPGVSLTKSATPAKFVVPENADVDPAGYPSGTFTLVARNTSPARASYLRVTDPAPCSSADTATCVSGASQWAQDPFVGVAYDAATNPFETTTLTKIAFTLPSAAIVDPTASVVTLRHRAADGTLSSTTVSVTAAQALGAAQLADVVGVSVLYRGTDPATNGGSIDGSALTMALTAQLRVTERSDPTTKVSAHDTPSVSDLAFAQPYDPVLAQSGTASTPHDTAAAAIPLATGTLDIAPTKTIAPHTLLEKDRANPVSVTLSATDGAATVATERVTLSDTTPEFWDRFRLTGLGTVQLPAGADTVRVDVQLDGSATWTAGTPGATASLPSVALDRITGIRLVFSHTGDSPFSSTAPPQHWVASAVLAVALRDTRLDGSPIVFPTAVDDTLTATSERVDGLYAAKSADASDGITLDPGTFQLDVAKTPLGNVHSVSAGDSVPWTLTFHNTGTGYLDVTQLVDTLDAHLDVDGDAPTFSDVGGGLSTSPAWNYDPAARTLTLTWPAGQRMAPNETFTVTAGFVLLPGLTATQRATNQFVVSTTQTLAACTNTSGNGQGVLAGVPATDCGTTNYVQPQAGASLLTTKGSRGEVAGPQLVTGATNTANAAASCTPDADGFYRSPCAANSVIGATDEWKLTAQNSGTVAYRSLTMVDPLPQLGDKMLATGAARGSTYRPVLDGVSAIAVAGAPVGTTVVEEVTTAADACWGTGTTWNSDSTCSTHPGPGSWTPLGSYTGDWGAVTAIRLRLDFTTSGAASLAPGQTIAATYRTINQPRSAALPDAAPVSPVPSPPVAWNQYGATVVTTTGATIARAPAKAGVILPTGSIQLDKTITGAGSAYAPDSFVVDTACTIAGATMAMGADASRTLSKPALLARIDGLPLGAHCLSSEHGAVGAFGETSRSGEPVALDVTTATTPTDNVPSAQIGAISNAYDLGSLTIAKVVDTAATVGTFGPFTVTVACESIAGGAVTLDAADASFPLAAGASHPITGLPVGASCTVRETDADGATTTAFAGTGVTDHGDGSSTAVVQAAGSTDTITNTYASGTLSVLKTVDDPSGSYGSGPFTASVTCTYGGQTVFVDGAVPIVPGLPTPIAATFPVGTVCAVAEVKTGGATTHDDQPSVTITAGNTVADITNHFVTGALHIVKLRTGPGVAQFGDGPFTAHVVCTWDRDGTTVTIPLPGAGDVVLDQAGGYEATVSDLLVGASCVVTESDAGLAVATTFQPANGTVTVVAAPAPTATVTITNEFQVGRLELRKTADVTSAKVGQDVGYTIRVANTGGVDAKGAIVTDLLPAHSTVVSADGGAVTADRVTWTLADLPAGQSVSRHLVLRFSAAGDMVNHARLTTPPGPFLDPTIDDPCGDAATDACATVQLATLALTGLDDPRGIVLPSLVAMLLGGTLVAGAAIRRRRRS